MERQPFWDSVMQTIRMRFQQATPYVGYIVDDAGSGRPRGTDQHAIVREAGDEFKYSSRLVGWQCGAEPMFVAVHSYLDVRIDDEDAAEMVRDYLSEIGWFCAKREPDYII